MGASLRISKIVVFWCLATAILLVACNGPGDGGSKLTLADFQFLRLGMPHQEVVTQVGEADRDIGSGVHLMVYDLQDGTEMVLSFPSLDALAAAYLYKPESDERQVILGSDA